MSLTDLCAKRFSASYSARQLALGRIFYSLPLLWIMALAEGIPPLSADILWIYCIGIPLDTVAVILYMRSLSLSPLSLTVPFLSFTPLFLLVSSPLVTGEFPSRIGVAGMLLIAAGAYWLGVSAGGLGLMKPVKALVKERGAMMMLAVALIYAVTSSLGRAGVTKTSPSFFAATYYTLLAASLAAFTAAREGLRGMVGRKLLLLGLLNSAMVSFQFAAFGLAQAGYVVALKRSSVLIGIVFGVIFLREGGITWKLLAGVLMVAGIAMIAFFG